MSLGFDECFIGLLKDPAKPVTGFASLTCEKQKRMLFSFFYIKIFLSFI